MLADDLSGRSYVKARHKEALNAQIGRGYGSVEFKYQNISAVLDALGMPWIPGYKPMRNYQNAIFEAIDRYLTKYPEIVEPGPISPVARSFPTEIFVPAPAFAAADTAGPARLRHLVRKFDPVARDYRNRSLGKAGEQFVVDVERHLLSTAGHPDLAQKVRWVAAEDGDGAGYDVLSFDLTGRERLLEVKTTNGSARTPFFLTRTEADMAAERPADWRIYRVHQFAREPRIFAIAPPLEHSLNLSPEVWRASFSSALQH